MKIDSTAPSYNDDLPRWVLSNTLLGGTESMRKAGKALLPQEEGESDKAYAIRLSRSVLYNKYSKSVKETAGKLLAKGYQVTESVSPAIESLLDDCDYEQQDLNQFLSEVCQDSVAKGVSFVLVEYPVKSDNDVVTREQELQSGVRPYLVHIKPEQLFYFESVKGNLTVIRFFEYITEQDQVHTQIREITPDTWSTYRQSEKGEWQIVDSGEITLGQIPLVAFYSRRTGFMSARPPLEDLLQLNIKHWQSSSDQAHILHVARVPILFGTGLEDGIFEIGPNRLVRGEQGSTLSYVEHTGKAIEAGAKDLESLEAQMQEMSLAPVLSSKPGVQTATAHSIDSAEAHSILNLIRLSWEDSANLVLRFISLWLNEPQSAELFLDAANGDIVTGQEGVAELSKARLSGDISRIAYLGELKRRKILSENYDPAADLLLVDNEAVRSDEI